MDKVQNKDIKMWFFLFYSLFFVACYYWKGKTKVPPVRNLTVKGVINGLLISWSLPSVSTSASRNVSGSTPQYFRIEYKTVGPWLAVIRRIPNNVTSYLWTSASRGATYYFRVVSIHAEHAQLNAASEVVSFYTGGKVF